MRPSFVVALVVACALLSAGESLAIAPVPVRLDTRANVRFAPSTSAKIVVTLAAGSEVEVFGPAKEAADWFVIRFPREGRVWVHSRNLKPLDGGLRYQVTQAQTKARDDARLTADVVAELNEGDIVEDRGQVVGDWRAVAIPDAVAFVHKSVLKLPPDLDARLRARAAAAEAAERAWQQAMVIYAQYVDQVKANPKAAVGLDWAGLVRLLDSVVNDHASASVRLAATRVRESIAQLVPPAQEVAKKEGIQPPAPLPPPAPRSEAPASPPPAAAPAPRPLSDQEARAVLAARPASSAWQATGLLVLDDRYAERVGTRVVLMDENGDPVAFIKPKEGADLRVSEFVNRFVGAAGEVYTVPPEQSGLPRPVKLILAQQLAPAQP
ncbi:MAG: SH3 domain-containing protein [Planctomycetota bacterium]|nr:SH3 domain-containing protein [Planctomycetota bacterium]MCX8039618.1 SH3 domain-containing protein [Planctomycetota bacterium]MDW8373087.1 SH3 domain-containing protein [Planctomycetota bacterium]